MKKKDSANPAEEGMTIHEILNENGMKIAGWETVSCGFGIEVTVPVIVDKKTEERINPA